VLLGLAPAASRAETAHPAVDLRSHPEPHTPVAASLYLNDLAAVDDAHQQASVDLALRLTWRDPRLAGRFAQPSFLSLDEIWAPRFAIMSDRTLESRLPEKALVLPDGTVRYVQRYVGEVAFPTHLADFPFDRQMFELPVLFYMLPDEAAFSVDRSVPLAGARFSLPGWTARAPSVTLARGSMFSPAHTRLVLTLELRRQRGYYFWTIVLPLALVVVMGMIPFWIEHSIEARVGLSATSILTLIAFRFAMSQMVPPLPYLTRLDAFVLTVTLLVFLALIAVAAVSYLGSRGRTRAAERVDLVARVSLPVALVLLGTLSLAPWR